MHQQPAGQPASNRPVAIITGASAGIGLAFAEQLAREGHDLVLVARRLDRLTALAERLIEQGVAAHPVAVDLAEPGAAGTIVASALERFGRIDVLINNAGYGLPTRFTDTPWSDHRAFIDVLLTSWVELTCLALPSMRAQQRGILIHVASLAAFVPESPGSLYSAIKRFVVSFSRALRLELRDSGISSTAVCPGFTYSEFHDVMGNRAHMSTLPRWLWMDAAAVASIGLAAARRNRAVVIPGVVNKLIAALCWLLPASLLQSVAPRKILDRHEHVAPK